MIVPDIEKSQVQKELRCILDKYSSKELTLQEKTNLQSREKNVNYYLQLLEEFQSAPASNDVQFIDTLTDFIKNTLSHKEDELHQILMIYILLTASYITDFFNTQGLENKKRHIKKMKKIFIDSTRNVIHTYEVQLIKTIEEIKEEEK